MDDLRFFIWQIYLFATFLPFSAVQTKVMAKTSTPLLAAQNGNGGV
jgi:hypothetical protein